MKFRSQATSGYVFPATPRVTAGFGLAIRSPPAKLSHHRWALAAGRQMLSHIGTSLPSHEFHFPTWDMGTHSYFGPRREVIK